MKQPKSSRRPAARMLLASPLIAVALALAALSANAANAPSASDLGIVAPGMTISAVVWLKSSKEAAFDAAIAELEDASSASYHQWMQDADVAAYAPGPQDLATARASLVALGLGVDRVFDGGTLVRVSGSAAQLQAAFGTAIHVVRSADGRTLLKATNAPTYQGAHAELVGGISGLTGTETKPLVLRRIDLATRLPAPGNAAQAGTDPLAAFTDDCFGPSQTITMVGLGGTLGAYGEINAVYTGPTYLNPLTTANRPACGYTARQLVRHYGIDEAHALGLKGRGQTIVIVDAYGSPTSLADLNVFSQAMGLPPMTANDFQVVYPDGAPTTSDPDWALETTLDIEWAHAFAPEAKIVLAVAPSSDNAELAYAIQYAADHHLGNVISNSWGTTEAAADKSTAQMFDQVIKRAAARGVAVNVASGDHGDNSVGAPLGASSIPADSPFATSVGGTSIGVPGDNGPVEAAWGTTFSEFGENGRPVQVPLEAGFQQGSGGGESVFLRKPAWQRKLPGSGRQGPDISSLADPFTGAIIFQTDPSTGAATWSVVGGTSLASPVFSAIWALADQAAGESLGQAAPIVSTLPPFALRDVLPIKAQKHNTRGAISFRAGVPTTYTAAQLLGVDQTQPTGFVGTMVLVGQFPTGWNDIGFGTDSSLRAAPGWDNATGFGVPNGLLFIESARVFARH